MDNAGPQANRIESLVLSVVFSAVSVGLLAALGVATRTGRADADWWTRPAMAPAVCLSLLVLTNIITLWREVGDLRRTPPDAAERAEGLAEILRWLRPLEFLAYFVIYLFAIQHLGYGPSTLIFTIGLTLRAGLRGVWWIVAAIGATAAMILIFRVGLGVWMPAPEFYDLFPDALRSALIRWF